MDVTSERPVTLSQGDTSTSCMTVMRRELRGSGSSSASIGPLAEVGIEDCSFRKTMSRLAVGLVTKAFPFSGRARSVVECLGVTA